MNINALNIGRSEENVRANSINIKSNSGAEAAQSGGVADVFENVMISSAEKMTSTKVNVQRRCRRMPSTFGGITPLKTHR